MTTHGWVASPAVLSVPGKGCVHGSRSRRFAQRKQSGSNKSRNARSTKVHLFGRKGSSGDGKKSSSDKSLTPFPKDYDQMISQCQKALQSALDDNVPLMEIQFPPGGLDSVPGDVEGNTENNLTTLYLRGICSQFFFFFTAANTRIFFPDSTERNIALSGASNTPDGVRPPDNAQTQATFGDWPGAVDFLEAPDFLSVSGLDKILNKRISLSDSVKKKTKNKKDSAFVVAYPSLNISELVRTKELFDGERDKIKSNTNTPVIVCNGELERTRSNYYPPFWNAGEMGPLREFAREFDAVYWISNFKGSNPAVLFRAYPGPWQVLRRRRQDDSYEVVWTGDTFPGVQKVALEILPKYP